MSSVFVRWPLLRISVILQLLCSLQVQHADSALPSRMYVQAMAHAGSLPKRGGSKERNFVAGQSVDICKWSLWATGGAKSIVCVSPFFSLFCFTRYYIHVVYAPLWSP